MIGVDSKMSENSEKRAHHKFPECKVAYLKDFCLSRCPKPKYIKLLLYVTKKAKNSDLVQK